MPRPGRRVSKTFPIRSSKARNNQMAFHPSSVHGLSFRTRSEAVPCHPPATAYARRARVPCELRYLPHGSNSRRPGGRTKSLLRGAIVVIVCGSFCKLRLTPPPASLSPWGASLYGLLRSKDDEVVRTTADCAIYASLSPVKLTPPLRISRLATAVAGSTSDLPDAE